MPDYNEFAEAVRQLTDGLVHLGHIMIIQGAMGWMYQGDLERARETLAQLPAESLAKASAAAVGLAALTDELLAATARMDAD